MEKRKGLRKLLSVVLAFCLVAGMIPDAAFAQDEILVVSSEGEAATGTTEVSTEASTASAQTEEATEAAEAATETVAAGTEAAAENEAAETETATEAVAEAATETAETETETAASTCSHGNDAETCAICEVEALIAALPTVDEIAAMDTDGQNEIYTLASEICDAYYALSEEEQEQVSNIDTLWDVLDYFSGGISEADDGSSETYYVDESGTTHTITEYISFADAAADDNNYSSDQLNLGEKGEINWYVVDSDVTISSDYRISFRGTVYLILADGCTLTANRGVRVNFDGCELIIYGQSAGTGKLVATGVNDDKSTAIGSNQNEAGGTITINGGIIEATGYGGGAGIGGGTSASSGTITINGGTVMATGGSSGGAGIGGGQNGASGTITINGGYITATAGGSGSAIGAGSGGSTGTISITGGYFGTGDTDEDTVYGVNVVSGYAVIENTESTQGTWPYVVIKEEASYTVTLNTNGGTIADGCDVTSYTYGTGVTLPTSEDLTRAGYTFEGWYEDSDFSGDKVTAISATDYGDKVYYAKWEATDFVVQKSTGSYTYTDNLLTITSGGEFTISMNTYEGIISTETDRILVTAGEEVTITLVSVQITCSSASPFEIATTSGVTIKLSGENILTAATISSQVSQYAGLQNPSGNTLTITSAEGDYSTNGSLTATGGGNKSYYYGGAGIGGGYKSNGGTIIINGGTITAMGGRDAAGIGGGGYCACGSITINGGTVTASSHDSSSPGAGIGGGYEGNGGSILITGGTVTATSTSNGAGIGAGKSAAGGTITIAGGTVTASSAGGGAGIGGGMSYGGGTINISGGYIIASSSSGNPIGAGSGGSGGTINITGGYYGEGTLYSQVYDVEVADGYVVGYNAEEDSKDIYPYVIIEKDTELTVSFDAGNGGTCDDITVIFGSVYGDELPTPSLYGYTFKGWYTEADGGGDLIESETTVSIAGAHTLYALYELTPVDYIDESGEIQTCEEFTVITADMTELTAELTDGWYAVISDVTISDRITVSGEVHLILMDGHTLTASDGISVNDGSTLNIYGQSESTGKLAASSSTSGNAGIGGDSGCSAGTIIINGGVITANGGYNGAGIGGGNGGNGGSITINNGTVTSTGNYNGAGIGGGHEGSSGEITINGGTVTAISTHTGAGIGGGYKGAGETITINDGTVTATSNDNGAGIGGGGNCTGGRITISGGTVIAVAQTLTATQGSAGIGGGVLGDGGTITISGGTVTATGCGNGAGIGGGGGNGDNATGGSAGSISISGGYITVSSSKGSIIGAGSNSSDGTITITGGYFSDGILYTYAYDAEVATGYMVTSNTEEDSKETYPYVVTESETATVTFDTNDGTLSTETKTMEVTFHTAYGELPTATKDWCVFDSWNTAADGSGDEITSESIVSVYGAHTLYAIYTQVAVDYIDEDGDEQTCEEYTLLTSGMTTLSDGWYVVGSDVEISDRITVSDEVYLILVDGYTLTANSGITVNSGNMLVIYGQEESTGTLNATGSTSYYTGIGGSVSAAAGTITINGGVINAKGAAGAPGIGSGAGFNSAINTNTTVIAINNGTVTAVGGSDAAGIGGGQDSNGGTITITGGTVSATGGNFGAGIGGGSGGDSDSGNGGTITITGGFIYAASGNTCGAGIGGGNKSPAGTVSISGGYIVTSSIGDGDGYTGTDGTITITGGCFGEGVIADRTVYEVTVADAYGVRSNTETSTKATYPYKVVGKTPITGSVTISGSAVYGQTLTATATGTPDGTEDSLEYQWQRDGFAISGATDSTYTLTAEDVGSVITVVVSHPSCTTSLTVSTDEVAKATLTASISGTMTKVYDGTTDVSSDVSISLSGVVDGDEPTATAEFAYDSASVGDDKTITASDITLESPWDGCYELNNTIATTAGSITAAELSAEDFDVDTDDAIYTGSAITKTIV
ncbi:MAG: InlB B-repeat-containing protein, partial [Lachnospiraceae bacterium]|nr:InlB B-repeat-containing protein [Lachnospiraceae bacterium]